jgi:hypothetical protein
VAAAVVFGTIAFFWIASSTEAARPTVLVLESAGSTLAPGQLVHRLDTAGYALVSLGSAGRLHVRPGTIAEVVDARSVRLQRGELFAEIDRGPFAVLTDRGPVSVRGTKFGVSTDPARTFVYTVEGEVALDGGRSVPAGRSLVVGADAAREGPSPYDALTWLSPFRRPQPTLKVSGEGRRLVLELVNAGPAPVLLQEIDDWSQFLSLEVRPEGGAPFTADLRGRAAPALTAYRRLDGRLQISPDRPLSIAVDLSGILEPGRYRLRPAFTAKVVDEEHWSGMIAPADPIPWNVPAHE